MYVQMYSCFFVCHSCKLHGITKKFTILLPHKEKGICEKSCHPEFLPAGKSEKVLYICYTTKKDLIAIFGYLVEMQEILKLVVGKFVCRDTRLVFCPLHIKFMVETVRKKFQLKSIVKVKVNTFTWVRR